MTPQQFYDSPPIEVSCDLYRLERHDFDHIDFMDINHDANTEVSVRFYVQECFDGERGLAVFSVWLTGKPFMLCFEAGRGNQDDICDMVTDYAVYNDCIAYLHTLEAKKQEDEGKVCDPNADIPEHLLNFYGCDVLSYYDPTYVPKFKIGDIVTAEVDENHLDWMNHATVETRCEITNVRQFNPKHAYTLHQLDRRWKTDEEAKRDGDSSRWVMIIDKDHGQIYASGNDATVKEYKETL